MARAIRAVTIERGRDPRDLALLAFGGSGPAARGGRGARLLDIRRVLWSRRPRRLHRGGDARRRGEHELVRPAAAAAGRADWTRPRPRRRRCRAWRARRAPRSPQRATGPRRCASRVAADVRYLGQSSQLTVPVPEGGFDAAALHAAFEERSTGTTFGYVASEGEPVELVNLRLVRPSAPRRTRNPDFAGRSRLDPRALAGESGERMVSFARGAPPVAARGCCRAPHSSRAKGRRAGDRRELRHHHRGATGLRGARRRLRLHRDRDGELDA